MKWTEINLRHDKGFLRMTERPLLDHLVDKLNEIETTLGHINMLHIVQHIDDVYVQTVVQYEPFDNAQTPSYT